MTNPGNPNFKPPTLRLPKAPQPTKNDQVRAIVDITLSFMQKHLHKNGNVYLVNTATRQVFFIDEDSVFNTIADVALHERDIVISNSAIQMAKRILKSTTSAIPGKISLRVGLGQHAYFLDFADGVNYLKYSEDGVEQVGLNLKTTTHIDVDFVRPPNISKIDTISYWLQQEHARPPTAQDEPKSTDWLSNKSPCLNHLLSLTNIPEHCYSTVITWMVCTLFPERDQTVLEITGEETSGKTTSAWIIKNLIDPSEKSLNEAPDSSKEIIAISQSNHIIAIDNADDLSESTQKRIFELLTNGIQSQANHGNSVDAWTFTYRNPVIIASTSSILSHPLLAKKTISINLPILEKGKSFRFIKEEFLQNQPRALLELAEIAADTLKSSRIASHEIGGDIYFDTFTSTGSGVCDYFGIDVATFIETSKSLSEEVIDNILDESVIARSLISWAAENPEIKIKEPLKYWHKELIKSLPTEDHTEWPKSIRRFGAELKKIAPKLKKEGIYCKSLGKQGSNVFWEIWVTESATAPDDMKDM
jgi:hypothetical protein